MLMTHYEASIVSLKIIVIGVEPENGNLTVYHQKPPTLTERSFLNVNVKKFGIKNQKR